MISIKEYFNCVKTTMYQSVFTRRMSYILSLLVMLTCFVSNAEGSFSSEVFRLVAEGNCRFMCILKYLLLLLPLKLRYLWQLNNWFIGWCHGCMISIKFYSHQQWKGELSAVCWCLATRSPSSTAPYRWVNESNFIKSRGWLMFQKFEFQC